jgi:hypothetical protein
VSQDGEWSGRSGGERPRGNKDSAIQKLTKITRRKFLASSVTGGGLALGIHASRPCWSRAAAGRENGAWLLITPNDQALISITDTTVGENTLFGIAMFLAVDFPGGTEQCTRSRAWRGFFRADPANITTERLGWNGLTARTLLMEAAARMWSVGSSTLTFEEGIITEARLHAADYCKIAVRPANRFNITFYAGDEVYPMDLFSGLADNPFVAFTIRGG